MTNKERLYRVIDANLNRLKEGLRVVEDVRRYGFDNLAMGYIFHLLWRNIKLFCKDVSVAYRLI